RDDFAAVHLFAFEDVEVTPLRNQLLVRIATIGRRDDQTALALGLLAKRDGTAGFRQDRRFFRTTRFEQVGDARQTTGDVAGLRGFLRPTGDNGTDRDLRPIRHADQGVGRQEVLGGNVSTRQQQFLAVGIDHLDGRTNVLASSRTILRIENLDVGQTGQLVGLALDGDALLHADEGHGTLHFGHDRVGVRVPLGDDGASVDLVAFLHGNHGTVRQLVALALATELVGHGQLAGTGYRHQVAVGALDVLQVVQTDRAAVLDLDVVGSRGSAGSTTDVEGTHGQLGTRLTNRLGGDNADCLTDVDLMTTRQSATGALVADALPGLSGDRRTHDHFVDAVALDELDPFLID